MSELSYEQIDRDVLGGLRPPVLWYYAVMAVLAGAIGWFLICWVHQVKTGMGVTGLNNTVGWALYIGEFVFWVGIAHSGTLISAILHLVRSKWRNAISRASETMTIFAIATAGLFPLVHLGRVWVVYYILPYPTERGIYPNFQSALVCDVAAVSTYLTVSLIFYYVGLIPDLAAARDSLMVSHGPHYWRTRLYRWLSLGWMGAASQWRYYGRGYLYFAALATPLVVSVHSVVSWDFASSLLPGWHSSIFPPYFVAGAIHSGLAMVLTLVIPMRSLLGLDRVIKVKHFEAIAQVMLVTTAIVGYAYVVEPFMAWYSANPFERQFYEWQRAGATGWTFIFWLLPLLNVLVPVTYGFKKLRTSLKYLWVTSILVNVGMWLERFHIVSTATMHDFLPNNWAVYLPTWVEFSIFVGTAAFFFFCFSAAAKLLPMVPLTDYKELPSEEQTKGLKIPLPDDPGGAVAYAGHGLLAIYKDAGEVLKALQACREAKIPRIEMFTPARIGAESHAIGLPRGPVRYWTLVGGLTGLFGAFWLCIDTATLNNLIVGGKHPISFIPYCIIGFEGTVLIGSIFNLVGMIFHARLWRFHLPTAYDRRFSQDRFGIFIAGEGDELREARRVLTLTVPEEIRVVG